MILKKNIITALALIVCGVWASRNAWAISGFTAGNISKEAIVDGLIPHAVSSKATALPVDSRTRGIGHVGNVSSAQQPSAQETTPPADQGPAVALQFQFGLDSAALTPDSVAMLNKVARALEDERLNMYKFSIEGYTCDLGSAAHNWELSRRRAYAVAEWLTSFSSLSPDQFEVKWFGESCPLVPNTNEANRRKNRSVVIRNTLEKPEITLKSRPAALQIFRRQGKQEEIISDGDVLTRETPYSLTFKTEEKPYTYICQIDARGKVDLIFPNKKYSSHQNPIVPGTSYRIPEQTATGFYLDNTVGPEQVILLAMAKPLTDPLSVCKATLDKNIASQTDAALKRGIGGVSSMAPAQKTSLPLPAVSGGMQLCEVTAGGKLSKPVVSERNEATRGIGGVTKDDISKSANTTTRVEEGTCQGIFLKRIFLHK